MVKAVDVKINVFGILKGSGNWLQLIRGGSVAGDRASATRGRERERDRDTDRQKDKETERETERENMHKNKKWQKKFIINFYYGFKCYQESGLKIDSLNGLYASCQIQIC